MLGSVVTMSIDGHQENSATHQIEKRKNNNKKKLRGLKKKGGEKRKGGKRSLRYSLTESDLQAKKVPQ